MTHGRDGSKRNGGFGYLPTGHSAKKVRHRAGHRAYSCRAQVCNSWIDKDHYLGQIITFLVHTNNVIQVFDYIKCNKFIPTKFDGWCNPRYYTFCKTGLGISVCVVITLYILLHCRVCQVLQYVYCSSEYSVVLFTVESFSSNLYNTV